MNLARHAHHMKNIFTDKKFLPVFLSSFSFGEQQNNPTHLFHL